MTEITNVAPEEFAGGRSLSITQKLLAIVAMLVAMMLGVAAIGAYQMNKIGGELMEIAEHDIPITEAVTNITIHQLEQAIALERAFRFGREMQNEFVARQHFKDAVTEFERFAEQVDGEFKDTEAHIEEILKTKSEGAERAEFEHVLEVLSEIDEAHTAFETHAREALEMLERGGDNLDAVIELEAKVEAEETKLDRKLRGLLVELEKSTRESAKKAEQHEQNGLLQMVVMAAISAVLGFAIAVFMARRGIARPLAEVMKAMNLLASGDTTATLTVRSNDEIGQIASTFLVFRERMAENEKLLEQQKAEEKAKRVRAEKVEAMIAGFDKGVTDILGTVSAAAAELEQTAQSMSATAEEASGQASVVATASNQATANVQTVATAAEELSASIAEIGRQVSQSTKIAANAVVEAEATNATVQGLAEAASKIGEVVSLINDIAGQTNLLALNATIEAARAGDAGKGFAVVAQEVKNLANQTAKATEEISAQILAVQEETSGAVGAIEKITGIISEINDISTTIASAVEEQGVSTQEIARNVQQAAQGTQEVNANIGGVTESANQTGAAANQVLASSGELSQQAERLRGEVDEFLRDVRTA